MQITSRPRTLQSTVNHTDSEWTPPEINEAISLFREYMRGKIVYTGRTLNANTFARILPLYQGFVEENSSFLQRSLATVPSQNRGQKGRCLRFSGTKSCRQHWLFAGLGYSRMSGGVSLPKC